MSDSTNFRTLGDAVHAARQHAAAPFITAQRAAEILELDVGTLAKWRWLRKGPPVYKQGRVVRYLEDEVRAWMKGEHAQTPAASAPTRQTLSSRPSSAITPATKKTLLSPGKDWTPPSKRQRRQAS
jgi:hypothetical protein